MKVVILYKDVELHTVAKALDAYSKFCYKTASQKRGMRMRDLREHYIKKATLCEKLYDRVAW